LVWKQQDQGQWVALIRFNRQFEARMEDAWPKSEIDSILRSR
jgi:hypothetical protein